MPKKYNECEMCGFEFEEPVNAVECPWCGHDEILWTLDFSDLNLSWAEVTDRLIKICRIMIDEHDCEVTIEAPRN